MQSLNLKQITIWFLAFFALAGYEYHIYNSIGIGFNQVILLAAFFAMFVAKHFEINKVDYSPAIFFFIIIIYSIFSLLIRLSTGIADSPFELIKNGFLFINFLAIQSLFSRQDTENLLRNFFYLIVIASVISLPIMLFGHFLIWQQHNLRLASIFLDPNYYGVLVGFGLLYGLLVWKPTNKILYYIVLILLMANLLATFSKGAIISFVITIIYVLFKKFPVRTSLLALVSGAVVLSTINVIIEKLSSINLLRIGMGLNRRDIYWSTAFERIKENPFFGYGTKNVSKEIMSLGYGNSSFHNYYIEQAYINGLPFTVGIIILLLITVIKLNRLDYRFCALLSYLAIAANNFSYSIGGVGFLSILFTFMLLYNYQKSDFDE